ncbi:MAG: hypothetical protein IBJ09_11935 [Bacteroidia bacterium]|nr:hypothetical protein [Bacteroidia bacterium]
MKKQYLAVLLFCLVLVNTSAQNKSTEPTFMEYAASLPALSLPFHTRCYETLIRAETGHRPELIEKFSGLDVAYIYGRLFQSGPYTGIIYLYPGDNVIPVLVVNDTLGAIRSSLHLSQSYCGESENSWGIDFASIRKDYSVRICDTFSLFRRDHESRILEHTRRNGMKCTDYLFRDGMYKEVR